MSFYCFTQTRLIFFGFSEGSIITNGRKSSFYSSDCLLVLYLSRCTETEEEVGNLPFDFSGVFQ